MTTDGWVDPHRHVAYVCVTTHYINGIGQLTAEVLATRQMEASHTAENIFAEVSAVLDVSIMVYNLQCISVGVFFFCRIQRIKQKRVRCY